MTLNRMINSTVTLISIMPSKMPLWSATDYIMTLSRMTIMRMTLSMAVSWLMIIRRTTLQQKLAERHSAERQWPHWRVSIYWMSRRHSNHIKHMIKIQMASYSFAWNFLNLMCGNNNVSLPTSQEYKPFFAPMLLQNKLECLSISLPSK